MITHRYNIWKEKPTSRPSLIITDDDGNTYHKVAVFKNEESVKAFDNWLEGVLKEVTVDAVPIEWLKEWSRLYLAPTKEYTDIIEDIIKDYREEQSNES